jgi:hypothetical protein
MQYGAIGPIRLPRCAPGWNKVLLQCVSRRLGDGLGHCGLFSHSPAYIYPVEPRKEPNFGYRLLRLVYPLFRLVFPNQVIRADDLARVMVDAAVRGTAPRTGPVFENRDILAMVESVHQH